MVSNDINAVLSEIRELITVNREQIAEMKALSAQIQRDNAEFHVMMIKSFNEFSEKIDAKFEAFRNEMNARFDAFRAEMNAKFDAFRAETDVRFEAVDKRFEATDAKIEAFRAETNKRFEATDAKIEAFKAETNARFETVQSQIHIVQNDITGLKHDVANLFTWNYWTLSIIIALVAMPHIVDGIKSIIGALSELILAVVGLFRKSDK